jgi:predicted nucleotidyltransferase
VPRDPGSSLHPPALDELRGRRDELYAIAARRGARHIRVFGSVARGEEGSSSDVDLLVTFAPGRSLLDQVHLIEDLSEVLGIRVDVVAEGGLLPRDQHIIEEAVAL